MTQAEGCFKQAVTIARQQHGKSWELAAVHQPCCA